MKITTQIIPKNSGTKIGAIYLVQNKKTKVFYFKVKNFYTTNIENHTYGFMIFNGPVIETKQLEIKIAEGESEIKTGIDGTTPFLVVDEVLTIPPIESPIANAIKIIFTISISSFTVGASAKQPISNTIDGDSIITAFPIKKGIKMMFKE